MSKSPDMQSLMNRYGIVGRNDALREALATAVLVAPTDLSVLIQGESGVGKEVIPRIIHDHSKRRGKTYIAINCGAIPEGTIDSELFGHEKGAFTSAIGEHEGFFGAADGGTLFLDEVGELPLNTQARLLRVLETGEYLRVGSSTPRKTNVRIVAATNVDIPTAIKQGRFREDLYYRLSTINIQIPPLRKRQGDAVLLFKKFALDTASRYNIPEPIRLTPEAEAVVNSYKWPGNIRQLRNVTEQLSILSESRSITPEMLAKLGITPNSDTDTGIATVGGNNSGTQHDYEQEIKILAHAIFELRSDVQELKEKLQGHNWHEAQASNTLPVPLSQQKKVQHTQPEELDISTAEEIVDDDTLNIGDMEKRNILLALQRNHYKRKLAAEELGISERTLYRKIKAYGIDE